MKPAVRTVGWLRLSAAATLVWVVVVNLWFFASRALQSDVLGSLIRLGTK